MSASYRVLSEGFLICLIITQGFFPDVKEHSQFFFHAAQTYELCCFKGKHNNQTTQKPALKQNESAHRKV